MADLKLDLWMYDIPDQMARDFVAANADRRAAIINSLLNQGGRHISFGEPTVVYDQEGAADERTST